MANHQAERDSALAGNAVRETLGKAWRSYGRCRKEASEKTWLMRIAVATCRDLRRSKWFIHMDRRGNCVRWRGLRLRCESNPTPKEIREKVREGADQPALSDFHYPKEGKPSSRNLYSCSLLLETKAILKLTALRTSALNLRQGGDFLRAVMVFGVGVAGQAHVTADSPLIIPSPHAPRNSGVDENARMELNISRRNREWRRVP